MDSSAIISTAPIAGFALGWLLKKSLLNAVDAEAVCTFTTYVTLPSLILHSFNGQPPSPAQCIAVVGAVVTTVISSGLAWYLSRNRHPRERAQMCATVIGTWPLLSLPFVATFFQSTSAMQTALLWLSVTHVTSWAGEYLCFASAGPAFPEKYAHDDGGVYRGEWRGLAKHGLGAYTYKSGAKYLGEWRNGKKEGRGLYYFPSGGVYEGEWRDGKQQGIGVRTYASGKVVAGLWRDGRLESPMEEESCVLAVQGATEAAAAAKKVKVGSGGLEGAFRRLATQPMTWAYAVSGIFLVLHRTLPPTLGFIAEHLSSGQMALSALAFGLMLDTGSGPVKAHQVHDMSAVMLLRYVPPLCLLCACCLVLEPLVSLAVVAPMAVASLGPIPPHSIDTAHEFRLNESLIASTIRSSMLLSLSLTVVMACGAVVAVRMQAMKPLLIAVGVAAGVVAAWVVNLQKYGSTASLGEQEDKPPKGRVRMIYAPSANACMHSAPSVLNRAVLKKVEIARVARHCSQNVRLSRMKYVRV